jgi:AcrR family transcriptional regulator
MEVFWARGYEHASVAVLGEAMGLSPPSLYAAFGSKEALYREACDLYGEAEGGIWEAMNAPNALEAVAQLLEATARSFTRPDKPRGCMIVLGGLHVDDDEQAVAEDLRSRRAASFDELKARLERAVAEGDLPEGVDTAAIARFYLTVQNGMAIQARDGADYDALMQVVRGALLAWPELTKPRARRPA